MSRDITVTLPDTLYAPMRRMADETRQPPEVLVISAIQASLPSIENLPIELARELVPLETLENDALEQVMRERVPEESVRELETLLDRNQMATITESEKRRLKELQQEADLVMLRKARAAVLLRFRGVRIPTVTELASPPPAK